MPPTYTSAFNGDSSGFVFQWRQFIERKVCVSDWLKWQKLRQDIFLTQNIMFLGIMPRPVVILMKTLYDRKITTLENGPTPASFSFIFSLFKQTIQFLQQINVKKCHVHPVSGAGIQTHDLWRVSLLL